MAVNINLWDTKDLAEKIAAGKDVELVTLTRQQYDWLRCRSDQLMTICLKGIYDREKAQAAGLTEVLDLRANDNANNRFNQCLERSAKLLEKTDEAREARDAFRRVGYWFDLEAGTMGKVKNS